MFYYILWQTTFLEQRIVNEEVEDDLNHLLDKDYKQKTLNRKVVSIYLQAFIIAANLAKESRLKRSIQISLRLGKKNPRLPSPLLMIVWKHCRRLTKWKTDWKSTK